MKVRPDRGENCCCGRSLSFMNVGNKMFDMFVINMVLYTHGFMLRLLFPVRATFFYDSPLGWFVNGIMSWFSMFPPIETQATRVDPVTKARTT